MTGITIDSGGKDSYAPYQDRVGSWGPGAGSSTRLVFGADAILRRVADHRPTPERVPNPPR